MMQQDFPGKRILITGAGSGLGQATAIRFAAAGWQVAVTDVDSGRIGDTIGQLAGSDHLEAVLDVRSQPDWDAARARVESSWGGLDVVVNNAGVAAAVSVADASDQDWEWMMDINLMGVIRGCRCFVPLMRNQGRGHVVNVSSFAGLASAPGMATYNVAKAGVISLSETLRAEGVDHGIGVSVVCPSFFATNLLDSVPDRNAPFRHVVQRMMDKSSVTSGHVAECIYDGVLKNRFMLIPHPKARQHYWLKRLLPETYFKQLVAFARRQKSRLGQAQRP